MILNILTPRGDDRGTIEVPEAVCIDASPLPRSVPRLLNVLFSMEPRLPRPDCELRRPRVARAESSVNT